MINNYQNFKNISVAIHAVSNAYFYNKLQTY